MKQLTVGGCRIPVSLYIQENLKQIKKAIDWAADNSIDIMSTPECALSGYMWAPSSQTDPRVIELSAAIDEITKYCLDKKVDLVLGTAWYDGQNRWCNIQAYIINGVCQQVYYKTVLFGKEMQFYSGGNELTIFEYKNFKVGSLICNDLWSNPMIWPSASATMLQKLMYEQVDLVFVAANLPHETTHKELFYQWNDSCIRMFGGTGKWNTVICDAANVGLESLCPVGVVERNATWAVKGHDSETCYFKHTVN
jgi:predicted amidohydrolase